jgi:hypothetical protein
MEMSMSDKIHELLNRNLQEVFGVAAHRRAAIEELYREDCVLYVAVGVFVGRDALDKFAETCARPILTSRTRHAESRKRSTVPAAWPGGPVRAANGPTIPAWT